MIRNTWLYTAALSLLCTAATAAPPTASPAAASSPQAQPVAKAKPVRRAQKLDRARSRASRIVTVRTVVVKGRRQRPLALFETSPEPVRFPVGTARYSPRDQRFLKNSNDRW